MPIDHDALDAVFRRYRHLVHRFAMALTGSASAADDVTQEVFVILCTEMPRYDPSRASFSTYLYGIARNVSRDRLRRDRRFLPIDSLGSNAGRTAYRHDPADALHEAETAAWMQHVLRQLPATYRDLIVLCDLRGVSYADAGTMTGLSQGTVKSRLHRGRQMLRRRLRARLNISLRT